MCRCMGKGCRARFVWYQGCIYFEVSGLCVMGARVYFVASVHMYGEGGCARARGRVVVQGLCGIYVSGLYVIGARLYFCCVITYGERWVCTCAGKDSRAGLCDVYVTGLYVLSSVRH